MTVFGKRVTSQHPTFRNRQNVITTSGSRGLETTVIPVPNDVTLCNGCNDNIESGYLVYLDKLHLKRDTPYDYYCESCFREYFPKAVIV